MYNPYFNQQASVDRINSINAQIAELEMKKNQAMMPQPITQNFQISSGNGVMRYANNLEEVQRDFVISDTPYFSKDMSVLWVKNTNGEIKIYELNEIIEKDEKDLQIEILKARINELEANNEPSNEYVNEPVENEKPTSVQPISRVKKK